MAPRKKSPTASEILDFDAIDTDGVVCVDHGRALVQPPVPAKSSSILVPGPIRRNCVSLGVGSFPAGGRVIFTPTLTVPKVVRKNSLDSIPEKGEVRDDSAQGNNDISTPSNSSSKPAPLRRSSSFMRISDLGMDESTHSYPPFDINGNELHPHLHRPSPTPPPGVDHDPKEHWVALDNGEGSHAPIAPAAINALAQNGLSATMNKKMWTAAKPTEKLIKNCPDGGVWADTRWETGVPVCVPKRGTSADTDVLLWSGKFEHSYYGSDLPAVRSEGVVNASPEALLDLLVDSSRVKEYNKLSLGRSDLLVLQDDLHNEGPFGKSVTKIMKSQSKPPLVRKTMELVLVIHARELSCGSGYLLVSRAVSQDEHKPSPSHVVRCEILMSVNIIRRVQGDTSRCVLVTVNHLRSPMVPMMLAKKLAVSAATNFMNDVREAFKND